MRHETFKPLLKKMARNVTSVRHGRYGPTAACAALQEHNSERSRATTTPALPITARAETRKRTNEGAHGKNRGVARWRSRAIRHTQTQPQNDDDGDDDGNDRKHTSIVEPAIVTGIEGRILVTGIQVCTVRGGARA